MSTFNDADQNGFRRSADEHLNDLIQYSLTNSLVHVEINFRVFSLQSLVADSVPTAAIAYSMHHVKISRGILRR